MTCGSIHVSKKYGSEKHEYTFFKKKLFTEDTRISNKISGPLNIEIIGSFYFLLEVFYIFQMLYHK